MSTISALPPGTLEFLPHEQKAFQDMLETIRRAYERYGFVPLETPVFELTQVLLNKSGAQTDKQIYYVQSSGALAQGHRPDLALRFDLTVPLARYVARYERHLAFPFRRHQIQRVYRGERQQKGRYREFYQCDIDAIGKNDLPLYHDAEILAVIHEVFEELDLPFALHLNHRALLYGLVDFFGLRAVQSEILSLLDKTHKKGRGPTIQGLQDIILKDAPTLSPLKREEICGLLTLKAPPEQALSTLNALQNRSSSLPSRTERDANCPRRTQGVGLESYDFSDNRFIDRQRIGLLYRTDLRNLFDRVSRFGERVFRGALR